MLFILRTSSPFSAMRAFICFVLGSLELIEHFQKPQAFFSLRGQLICRALGAPAARLRT